jgi:phosphoserine phosphatase RsbU/P
MVAPSMENLARILIVDDAEPMRMLLAHTLNQMGYAVQQAEDGEDAYEKLVSGGVQMVVSDWMMPRLDGPSLCRRLRETDLGRYIYFILVSARGSSADMVEGMEAGADDFLSKPIDPNELRVRIRAGERILDLERRLAERNLVLTEAYELIRKDLDAAARVQRSLLPNTALKLEQVEFAWSFLPSLFVSGDELNFFRLDAEHVGFYNLDVAGHGVPAAMMSVTLSRLLSPLPSTGLLKRTGPGALPYRIESPAEVARSLNEQFQITAENSAYFTLVYGILHLPTGRVRLVQAGHPHPILLCADGSLRPLTDGDPPIGMMPDVLYADREIMLQPGDRLFIHSDGITECEDPNGSQFGEPRLSAFLQTVRGTRLDATLRALEQELRTWRGPAAHGFHDDISMLAFQYR